MAALLAAADPPPLPDGRARPAVGDPYFPLAGNGRYHVATDARLRPDERHLTGKAVLTARATQRLTRFDLDFKGLRITGLTVGRARAAHKRSGQELVVTPRRALHKGQRFRSPVTTRQARRSPTRHERGSPAARSSPANYQGAMTRSRPATTPLDKSSYDITITVPKGRTAVSNGVLLGQRTRKGKTTFHWRGTHGRLPRYRDRREVQGQAIHDP